MSADELVAALDETLIPFAEGVKTSAEELMQTSNNSPRAEGSFLLRALQRRSLRMRLAAVQQELMTLSDADRMQALRRFKALAEELASVDNI